MPPGPAGDLREGMNAASGTARTGITPAMGRTRTTTYPQTKPGPFPAAPIIMLAGTRLKDASGAGDADRAHRPGP
jgi:hypothetical protein